MIELSIKYALPMAPTFTKGILMLPEPSIQQFLESIDNYNWEENEKDNYYVLEDVMKPNNKKAPFIFNYFSAIYKTQLFKNIFRERYSFEGEEPPLAILAWLV